MMQRLAVTVALEHFTATLAREAMDDWQRSNTRYIVSTQRVTGRASMSGSTNDDRASGERSRSFE